MFGINGAEFVVLLVLALVVVGPERLPRYAEQLGGWVRSLRGFMSTAKERVAEEMGEDVAEVDWAALDPRRYDPRRIVREALLEDTGLSPASGRTTRASGAAAAATGATAATSAAAATGATSATAANPATGATPSSTAANAAAGAGTTGRPARGRPAGGRGATTGSAVAEPPSSAPFDDEAT